MARQTEVELERLIQEQARDRAAVRLYPHRREVSESDWGGLLDRLVDRSAPRQWHYLDGAAWSAVEHASAGLEAPKHLQGRKLRYRACPVCQGRELRGLSYCAACDRSGLDGRCEFPGVPVGQALEPDREPDRQPLYKRRRKARGAA